MDQKLFAAQVNFRSFITEEAPYPSTQSASYLHVIEQGLRKANRSLTHYFAFSFSSVKRSSAPTKYLSQLCTPKEKRHEQKTAWRLVDFPGFGSRKMISSSPAQVFYLTNFPMWPMWDERQISDRPEQERT